MFAAMEWMDRVSERHAELAVGLGMIGVAIVFAGPLGFMALLVAAAALLFWVRGVLRQRG